MYQKVIRDPGGDAPIRLLSDELIVNESVLLVPADTEAIFVCNGIVSETYYPGRHEIYTGVSPFFVRFRNLMTRGDPGISCKVFFVNKQKENIEQGGTGNIVFQENRYRISMNAKAGYTMRYVISNPRAFISKLVGMHNDSFDAEDIRPAITSMILPAIKESISESLSDHTVHAIQSNLTEMSGSVRARISEELLGYGITLRAIVITGINISEEEIGKLRELEEKEAKGRIDNDIEADNVRRVYGTTDNRTITEMVTGTLRGPGQISGVRSGTAGMVGAIATLPWQMEMARSLLRQSNITGTDAGTTEGHRPNENSFNRAKKTPPPVPTKTKTCRFCRKKVDSTDLFCKHCGQRL